MPVFQTLGITPRRALGLLAATVAGGLATVAYATRYTPRNLRIRHVAVSIPDLPPRLEGTRLAFLSDLHLNGPEVNRIVTEQAIDAILEAAPDLVLLGGDFFDHGHWHPDGHALDRLAAFEGRVFAVLGNHDFRHASHAATAITTLLEERGISVLRNRAVKIQLRDEPVVIAGVDCPYLRKADLPAALAEADGLRPLVLLAHAPCVADQLPTAAAGLVLTGHTHGGQIRLSPSQFLTPLDISFYLDRIFGRPLSRYQRGFHWVRGSLLYVTSGIGVTRWRLRFLTAPEVVMLHLTTQPANPDAPCDDAARYVRVLS